MKKYELTAEIKNVFGRTLHRIRALRDITLADGKVVNAGESGGWIETEHNLSQNDNAWISGNARVRGNARVFGNVWVSGNAWVYGNAQVYGNALVRGNARVFGDIHVCGDAHVYGDAVIKCAEDILWIGPIGNGTTTFFRTSSNEIFVTCGDFCGSMEKFLEAVREKHGNNRYAKTYRSAANTARSWISGSRDTEGVMKTAQVLERKEG